LQRRSDRKLPNKISKFKLDQTAAAENLPTDSHEAFVQYKNQHGLRLAQYFYEEQYGPFTIINHRVNLCGDLPFIALTCCEVLGEVWDYSHASNSFKFNIRNMEFFSSLRFFQTLQTGNAVNVTGRMVNAQFWEVVPSEKDSAILKKRYTTKFQNVKRLIEMHQLHDIPLWCCFTDF
jgi:hypothetical protein